MQKTLQTFVFGSLAVAFCLLIVFVGQSNQSIAQSYKQQGESCESPAECVSYVCTDGKCSCYSDGVECVYNKHCCSGACLQTTPGVAGGVCGCIAGGGSCNDVSECCSNKCENNKCVAQAVPEPECQEGFQRCVSYGGASMIEKCTSGAWQFEKNCAGTCKDDVSCGDSVETYDPSCASVDEAGNLITEPSGATCTKNNLSGSCDGSGHCVVSADAGCITYSNGKPIYQSSGVVCFDSNGKNGTCDGQGNCIVASGGGANTPSGIGCYERCVAMGKQGGICANPNEGRPINYCDGSACLINLITATDPDRPDAGRSFIFCPKITNGDNNCYCYNLEKTSCYPGCEQRCQGGKGCQALVGENCCNNLDDDFDGMIDAQDSDCNQAKGTISLMVGNNSVCWRANSLSYSSQSSFTSPTFSCPQGYWAKLTGNYFINSFEELYMIFSGGAVLPYGYGYGSQMSSGQGTLNGIVPSNSISLRLDAGGSSQGTVNNNSYGAVLSSIECIKPSGVDCGQCGDGIFWGLFNVCDKEECQALGQGSCLFDSRGIGGHCYNKAMVNFTVRDAVNNTLLPGTQVSIENFGNLSCQATNGQCSIELGLGASYQASVSGSGLTCLAPDCLKSFSVSLNPTSLTLKPNKVIDCSDSDASNAFPNGAKNYYQAGTVKETLGNFSDKCLNNTTLTEYSCSNNKAVSENYTCSAGCYEGSCLRAEAGSMVTVVFETRVVDKNGLPLSDPYDETKPRVAAGLTIEVVGDNWFDSCLTSYDGKCALTLPVGSYQAYSSAFDAFYKCKAAYGCPKSFSLFGSDTFINLVVELNKDGIPERTCNDTDGGIDIETKGALKMFDPTMNQVSFLEDYCGGGYLFEGYCDGLSYFATQKIGCQYGCLDGACLPPEEEPPLACAQEGQAVELSDSGRALQSCCDDFRMITLADGSKACVNCGNGVCSSPENEENCLSDCKQEQQEEALVTFRIVDEATANSPTPLYLEGAKGGTTLSGGGVIACSADKDGFCSLTLPIGNEYQLVFSAANYFNSSLFLTVTPAFLNDNAPKFILLKPIKTTVKTECSDTDDGKNYYTPAVAFGTSASGEQITKVDTCVSSGSSVGEGFCLEGKNGFEPALLSQACQFGCEDGACKYEANFYVLGMDGDATHNLKGAKVSLAYKDSPDNEIDSCQTTESGLCEIPIAFGKRYLASVRPVGYGKYSKEFAAQTLFDNNNNPVGQIVELNPKKEGSPDCSSCGLWCTKDECLSLGSNCVFKGYGLGSCAAEGDPLEVEGQVVKDEGGSATKIINNDLQVSLVVPAKAAKDNWTISIAPSLKAPDLSAGRVLVGNAVYDIKVFDSQNREVHQFSEPITIRIVLSDRVLSSFDINSLVFKYYNETSQQWENLPISSISGNTVTIKTNHLSLFGLIEEVHASVIAATADPNYCQNSDGIFDVMNCGRITDNNGNELCKDQCSGTQLNEMLVSAGQVGLLTDEIKRTINNDPNAIDTPTGKIVHLGGDCWGVQYRCPNGCQDGACISGSTIPEDCSAGGDEDGNGLANCDDPVCLGKSCDSSHPDKVCQSDGSCSAEATPEYLCEDLRAPDYTAIESSATDYKTDIKSSIKITEIIGESERVCLQPGGGYTDKCNGNILTEYSCHNSSPGNTSNPYGSCGDYRIYQKDFDCAANNSGKICQDGACVDSGCGESTCDPQCERRGACQGGVWQCTNVTNGTPCDNNTKTCVDGQCNGNPPSGGGTLGGDQGSVPVTPQGQQEAGVINFGPITITPPKDLCSGIKEKLTETGGACAGKSDTVLENCSAVGSEGRQCTVLENCLMADPEYHQCINSPEKALLQRVLAWLGWIAFTIAGLFVMVGAFMVMTSSGDQNKMRQGKRVIIWASIGLAVLLSSRLIIGVLEAILDVNIL